MHISPTIRKVFEGVATRHEMHRMFNRHRGNPAMAKGEAGHLFAGEWFEIAESDMITCSRSCRRYGRAPTCLRCANS